MSFDKFLKNEIQKELDERERFKSNMDARKAAKQIEQERARVAALEFRNLVEGTHTLLMPVIRGFTANANDALKTGRFKLVAEKPLAHDSLYHYKILKKEKTGIKIWGLIDTSIDYGVVDIHFGYNFYGKLFIVRMEGAGSDILNYDREDVGATDFRKRFAQDLIRRSGHYMRTRDDYLT